MKISILHHKCKNVFHLVLQNMFDRAKFLALLKLHSNLPPPHLHFSLCIQIIAAPPHPQFVPTSPTDRSIMTGPFLGVRSQASICDYKIYCDVPGSPCLPKQRSCLIQADSTFRQIQTRFNMRSSFVMEFIAAFMEKMIVELSPKDSWKFFRQT